LAFAAERLTIPNVKYIGITGDDVLKYDLKKHLIKLTDQDTARIKQVSEYDWFKNNKEWLRQFKMMKEMNGKVEIQSLSAKGISFISEVYLPKKIKEKDFLD
jgi:DNA topoisomerase-6 subunit A